MSDREDQLADLPHEQSRSGDREEPKLVKRPRGRPPGTKNKKRSVATEEDELDPGEEGSGDRPIKRKRGRPPKPKPEPDPDKPKRPRGRPPKYPKPPTDAEPSETAGPSSPKPLNPIRPRKPS